MHSYFCLLPEKSWLSPLGGWGENGGPCGLGGPWWLSGLFGAPWKFFIPRGEDRFGGPGGCGSPGGPRGKPASLPSKSRGKLK